MTTDIIKLVNWTLFDEVRPRYLLVIENSEDGDKIRNNSRFRDTLIEFEPIYPTIFYTICSLNHMVIMDIIYKKLGHKNFFLSEIQGYVK
jgi:hypothetical protein